MVTYQGFSILRFSSHPNVVGLNELFCEISRGACKLTDIKKNPTRIHIISLFSPYKTTEKVRENAPPIFWQLKSFFTLQFDTIVSLWEFDSPELYFISLHWSISDQHDCVILLYTLLAVMVLCFNLWNSLFCSNSYAIGGLAGGEDKDSFWRVVAQCTASLPEDKPRYVMVMICILLLFFTLHFFFLFLFSNIYVFLIFLGCRLSTGHCSM